MSDDRLNDILDKVIKYGINEISYPELIYLDNLSHDIIFKTHHREKNIFYEKNGYFIFKHMETIVFEEETRYNGIFYTHNFYLDDIVIKGELEGDIIHFDDGGIFPDICTNITDEDGIPYDIFEFSQYKEKELYDFLSYIINII